MKHRYPLAFFALIFPVFTIPQFAMADCEITQCPNGLSQSAVSAIITPPEKEMTFEEALAIGKSIYYQVDESMIDDQINHTVKTNRDGTPLHDSDPIKKKMTECLVKNSDSWWCLSDAYHEYDKVLNLLYKGLTARNRTKNELSDAQKKLLDDLIKSERLWLSFRDAEARANGSYVQSDNFGSVMNSVVVGQEVALIRERIAELMVFYGEGQG